MVEQQLHGTFFDNHFKFWLYSKQYRCHSMMPAKTESVKLQ